MINGFEKLDRDENKKVGGERQDAADLLRRFIVFYGGHSALWDPRLARTGG